MSAELVNPFIFTGLDYCHVCHKAHVLEIYTIYDKPIGFSALLNFKKDIAGAVNVPLSYGRCRNCGHRFKLSWDSDGLPLLVDNPAMMEDFISRFKDFELKEATEDAYVNAKAEGVFRN